MIYAYLISVVSLLVAILIGNYITPLGYLPKNTMIDYLILGGLAGFVDMLLNIFILGGQLNLLDIVYGIIGYTIAINFAMPLFPDLVSNISNNQKVDNILSATFASIIGGGVFLAFECLGGQLLDKMPKSIKLV